MIITKKAEINDFAYLYELRGLYFVISSAQFISVPGTLLKILLPGTPV